MLFLCKAPWAFPHSVDSLFVSDKGYNETQNGKGISESTEKSGPDTSQQHPTILCQLAHAFIYLFAYYTHVCLCMHRGPALPIPMRLGLCLNLELIFSLLDRRPASPSSPRYYFWR